MADHVLYVSYVVKQKPRSYEQDRGVNFTFSIESEAFSYRVNNISLNFGNGHNSSSTNNSNLSAW